VHLDDAISMHIDPILHKLNRTHLEDKFGSQVHQVTIRNLLHMSSGISDYDRGNYSLDQFKSPSHDYSPLEILSHYVPAAFDFEPGSKQSYCSTNYILLGLVLANHLSTAESWQSYDQMTVIPQALRAAFNHSVFADKGACSEYTQTHGFMAPGFYDPDQKGDKDIWNVSCVGGWTGGNYVGSVEDVAKYTYDLYGASPKIVSRSSVASMLNFTSPGSAKSRHHFKFYGMGTFSLDWTASTLLENVTGYGHVGDTYGYQSQTTYFPGIDGVITVATNIETDSQAQPAEISCILYHAIVAHIQGKRLPRCKFNVPHRFIGTCSCGL